MATGAGCARIVTHAHATRRRPKPAAGATSSVRNASRVAGAAGPGGGQGTPGTPSIVEAAPAAPAPSTAVAARARATRRVVVTLGAAAACGHRPYGVVRSFQRSVPVVTLPASPGCASAVAEIRPRLGGGLDRIPYCLAERRRLRSERARRPPRRPARRVVSRGLVEGHRSDRQHDDHERANDDDGGHGLRQMAQARTVSTVMLAGFCHWQP